MKLKLDENLALFAERLCGAGHDVHTVFHQRLPLHQLIGDCADQCPGAEPPDGRFSRWPRSPPMTRCSIWQAVGDEMLP